LKVCGQWPHLADKQQAIQAQNFTLAFYNNKTFKMDHCCNNDMGETDTQASHDDLTLVMCIGASRMLQETPVKTMPKKCLLVVIGTMQ